MILRDLSRSSAPCTVSIPALPAQCTSRMPKVPKERGSGCAEALLHLEMSSRNENGKPQGRGPEILSPQEVKEKPDRKEIVPIDVRTPYEFGFERIPVAMHFSMSSLDPERLPTREGKPTVFRCVPGMRSHAIADRCARAGIAPLAHMELGPGVWEQAKPPCTATDRATGAMTAKQS